MTSPLTLGLIDTQKRKSGHHITGICCHIYNELGTIPISVEDIKTPFSILILASDMCVN
jgi:hypothetical protein